MKAMTVEVRFFFALLSLCVAALGFVGCSDREERSAEPAFRSRDMLQGGSNTA